MEGSEVPHKGSMTSVRSMATNSKCPNVRRTIAPLMLLLLRIAPEPCYSFILRPPSHRVSSPCTGTSPRLPSLSAKVPSPTSSTITKPPTYNRKQRPLTTKNSQAPVDHRQIAQAGRRGDTDGALALFHSIPHSAVTIRQFNAAIDACARARPAPRIDTAFELLHTTEQYPGVQPNVYTFGALLNALRRAGDIDRALSVLESMQAPPYSVEPNAVIYQSVIATAAAAADVTTALRILYDSHDAVTIIAYNAALSAAARAGNADKAMEVWDFLQTQPLQQPDAVTYGTVLAACEAARDWERVHQFAQEHMHALDDQGIATAIHACQQLGRAEGALSLLQRARRVDVVTYRLAISACARGGAWREGIELLEHVPVNDTMAYTAAITGCEYAGEWNEACRLLSRMRKNDCPFNCVTMAAVIGACATACSQQMALDNSEEEIDDTPKRKALQLLMAMRKDATVIDPNINVYNAAIRACAESRDLISAFSVLDLAEKDSVAPNVVTFGTLMTACERVASVKAVGRVLRMMKERGIKPNEIVFGAAISTCRKAGEPTHAYRLLELMQQDESLRPNAVTLNTAMLAQTENITSSADNAVALMNRAQTIFDGMARPGRQSYEILIRGYCTARRPGDAHRFLLRMVKDLGSTSPPDVNLYTLIVASFERNGKPREALRVMESMRESGYDFYPSTMLNTAFKRLVKLTNAALGGP